MDRAVGRARAGLGDDAAEVAAAQVHQFVTGLMDAGQWRPGDLDILIVADASYDAPRLDISAGAPAGGGTGPDAL